MRPAVWIAAAVGGVIIGYLMGYGVHQQEYWTLTVPAAFCWGAICGLLGLALS